MAPDVGDLTAPATAGGLEELDGEPIASRRPAPGPGWAHGLRTGTLLAAGRPSLWAYAVLAFLARGGILVMLAPIISLPTFVNLTNRIGPTSVTAAGPTDRLVMIIVVILVVVVVALVAGALIAAAAERALYPATVEGDPDDRAAGLLPAEAAADAGTGAGRRSAAWHTTLRVAVVRLILLAPVVVALVASVPEYVSVAYRELLLPADLAVPLPIRVLAGAPLSSVLLAVTWLLGEVLGGLAARRVVLFGSGAARAIGAAIMDLIAAPVTSALTLILCLVGSVALLVPALAIAGLAWDQARIALVDGRDPLLVLATTLILAAAWGLAVLVAALAAAWRSACWTAELARRPRRVAGHGVADRPA